MKILTDVGMINYKEIMDAYPSFGDLEIKNAFRNVMDADSFVPFIITKDVIYFMDACNCASFVIFHVIDNAWEYYTWYTYDGKEKSFELSDKAKKAFGDLLITLNN